MSRSSTFPLKLGEASIKERQGHIEKIPCARNKTDATDAEAIECTSKDYSLEKSGPACTSRDTHGPTRPVACTEVGSAEKVEVAGRLEQGDGAQHSTKTRVSTRRRRKPKHISLVDKKLTRVSVLS